MKYCVVNTKETLLREFDSFDCPEVCSIILAMFTVVFSARPECYLITKLA